MAGSLTVAPFQVAWTTKLHSPGKNRSPPKLYWHSKVVLPECKGSCSLLIPQKELKQDNSVREVALCATYVTFDYQAGATIPFQGAKIKNKEIVEESSNYWEVRGGKGRMWLAPQMKYWHSFVTTRNPSIQKKITQHFSMSFSVAFCRCRMSWFSVSQISLVGWISLGQFGHVFSQGFHISRRAFGLLRLEAIGHSRRQRFKRYITMTW